MGFERSSGYEPMIGLDVETPMYGKELRPVTSVSHSHIDGDPATTFTSLVLSVRYDDGYVAYLNGVEVGRTNAPADASMELGGDRQP